ncbi:MAG: hypothetical protein ACJAR1_002552 [Rubritalea sp.]|jgi:hypothetical protein|tara:strand:+ start:3540 stop:4235 length:696 start_codon:yes stop_codon:yes gene_type:complete
MRLLLYLILSTFSLTFSTSSAQEDKEKKSQRTCRIVFPERPNSSTKMAYIFDGKKSQQVYLPSMNFSPVISLPTGELTILLTANPVADPENPPLDAPMLKIPEGVRDFYILITPDLKNEILPLQMKLVNVTDGKLKPGGTLWFNTTGHQIVANLGKSKMSVAPKGQTVSKSPVSASGYYRAAFGYRVQAKGDIKKITEQQWWHDVKCRHVGFMVNSGGKLPKIYFFRDFRL